MKIQLIITQYNRKFKEINHCIDKTIYIIDFYRN
jgi:hypothetical protein